MTCISHGPFEFEFEIEFEPTPPPIRTFNPPGGGEGRQGDGKEAKEGIRGTGGGQVYHDAGELQLLSRSFREHPGPVTVPRCERGGPPAGTGYLALHALHTPMRTPGLLH